MLRGFGDRNPACFMKKKKSFGITNLEKDWGILHGGFGPNPASGNRFVQEAETMVTTGVYTL
jgi:hypothetical protein